MELQDNTNYFNVSAEHRIERGASCPSISGLICKNIRISGRRTSIRLEPEMWDALELISAREKCAISKICALAYENKRPRDSVTAAIRVYILRYYMSASTETGHLEAKHGYLKD